MLAIALPFSFRLARALPARSTLWAIAPFEHSRKKMPDELGSAHNCRRTGGPFGRRELGIKKTPNAKVEGQECEAFLSRSNLLLGQWQMRKRLRYS